MSTTFKPVSNIFDQDFRKQSTQRASELELHNEELDCDSDGMPRSEQIFDFSQMTLEEKILSGYYTAKPFMNEAYPGPMLNRPNLPPG